MSERMTDEDWREFEVGLLARHGMTAGVVPIIDEARRARAEEDRLHALIREAGEALRQALDVATWECGCAWSDVECAFHDGVPKARAVLAKLSTLEPKKEES